MANKTEWLPAPNKLILTAGELHVWRVHCEGQAGLVDNLQTALTGDERNRAELFRIESARRDFIIARATLRDLLRQYLNLRSEDIVLRYGVHGKPVMEGKGEEATLRFNISHSHGLALMAFGTDEEVGIDLEWVKPGHKGSELAERFFSEQEFAELSELPPNSTNRGFFNCWTRKEAYVKARGGGLQIPLRSFSVSVRDDRQEQLRDETGKVWTIYPVDPGPEFVGAAVSGGSGHRIRYWNWRWKE